LTISVHEVEKLSLEQIRLLVSASEGLRFASENREQMYGWVESALIEHGYARQGKAARGLLRRYLEKMTGLSRAQVSRLIQGYNASGQVRVAEYVRHRFASRYTRADVELLASVDQAHETLSGPATMSILKREFQVYGKAEFERLAKIFKGQFLQACCTIAVAYVLTQYVCVWIPRLPFFHTFLLLPKPAIL